MLLVVKNPPASAGDIRDMGSLTGSGGSPGEGHCLQNPKDRGAWRATVHSTAQSRIRLRQFSMHANTHVHIPIETNMNTTTEET